MAPKKKVPPAGEPKPPSTTPAPVQPPKTQTKPAPKLPVQPPKTFPASTAPKKPAEQPPKKPATLVNLSQSNIPKKVIPLQNTERSEKQLRELRAFKFGGKQTSIGIDDVASLISERARKFGGNVPLSGDEKRKRLEKFGGTDKELEKEQKKKRFEKFGKVPVGSGVVDTSTLTEEEKAVIEARRLKFNSPAVEQPDLTKKIKTE